MTFLPRLATSLFLTLLACGDGSDPVVVAPPPPPPPSAFTPGVPVYGARNFVEYVPGALAVVISVPHGGAVAPSDIPNRTVGTTVTDNNTIELGRAIAAALEARTGRAPHLVITHLRRTKLDANREVVEAAAGNPQAIQAWNEFHAFVDTAKAIAVAQHGFAVYLDLHGHGHPIARLELGYLLSAASLGLEDKDLNAGFLATSSLRGLPALQRPFAEVLRGPTSLGGLLAVRGFPAVPSPAMPSPGTDPYFNGGYNTQRHTDGPVVGLQIEANFTGVRDTDASRRAFASALAESLHRWIEEFVRRSW
jgi:N-formylglutamate amidohydrolase